MLGYEEGELADTADLWLQLTHPDDRERALASGDAHIAGLTPSIETELRLKHKQGHWVWVLDRGGIVERDASGKPVRLMGVQTDISKQKAAEVELEKVNVRFRLALAASGTGIWHYDIATNKSYWDARTRDMFGVVADTDEVAADLWHSFLHPDDKEATARAHQPPPGSDAFTASHYRIIKRDGQIRHLEPLVRFVACRRCRPDPRHGARHAEDKLREQGLPSPPATTLTGLWNRSAFDTGCLPITSPRACRWRCSMSISTAKRSMTLPATQRAIWR